MPVPAILNPNPQEETMTTTDRLTFVFHTVTLTGLLYLSAIFYGMLP